MIKNVKNHIAIGIYAFLVFFASSCAQNTNLPVLPPVQPNLSQRLDNLYSNDRVLWESEMKKLVYDETSPVPPRHLAYAIEHWNNRQHKDLCLQAAYRYLKARTKNGYLASSADRELLKAYIEAVLQKGNLLQDNNIRKLCSRLPNEKVCFVGY